MARMSDAPERVELAYRLVGRTHVFTAHEFRGFHIGSAELRTAFEQAAVALGEHVTNLYGLHDQPVQYKAEMTFDDFQNHLEMTTSDVDGFLRRYVVAKRAMAPAHA